MASRTKTKRRAPLMESDTEAALRRRGSELIGLILFALAALAATMIWTYSPDDPSLFSATDEAPRNALGLIGASLADPLHRALGWAAYGIPASSRSGACASSLHSGESRVARRAIAAPDRAPRRREPSPPPTSRSRAGDTTTGSAASSATRCSARCCRSRPST